MKKQRFATPDRRRYYQDPISNGERLCIAVVFGMMGFAFAWFLLGVSA